MEDCSDVSNFVTGYKSVDLCVIRTYLSSLPRLASGHYLQVVIENNYLTKNGCHQTSPPPTDGRFHGFVYDLSRTVVKNISSPPYHTANFEVVCLTTQTEL